MREQPCNDYYEDSSRPGHCGECGHAEKSHEKNQKNMRQNKPKVITSGGVSRIASADSLKNRLDPGFYILEMNLQGYYLTAADQFELPKKVYGSSHERAKRIIKTYASRGNKSMGVMCSGRPGTGKTILSKVTANIAADAGMPVIIIRQGYFGPPMSSFLESLPNKCLMFVDEIEKVYDSEEARHWLLSVLDGTVNSCHLWLSTCNDPDIGEAFESRPGRIRYHYRFEDMEPELVSGMISENIRNAAMRKAVMEVAEKIQNLTPDVLFSIIEECLIHNEEPSKFMSFLNVDTSMPSYFKAKGFLNSYVMTPHNRMRLDAMHESEDRQEKQFAHYAKENSLAGAIRDYHGKFSDRFKKTLIQIDNPWSDNPVLFDKQGNLYIDEYFEIEGKKVSVQWKPEQIKKSEFRHGAIIVHGPEKGDVLHFTPTKFSRQKGMMSI